MKKIALAMAAAIVISTAAMAQDKQESQRHSRPNKAEMVKYRTERMVKRYGLNDTQAKELLALNEKYAGKMNPGFKRHHRGPRPDNIEGKRPLPPKGDEQSAKGDGQPAKGDGQATKGDKQPPKGGPHRAHQGKHRGPHAPQDVAARKEVVKAYDSELQNIMTADQFKAYQVDVEKRRKEGPRGPRPQRDKKQQTS